MDTRPVICLRSILDAFTGYGLHACQIIADMTLAGLSVNAYPIAVNERFAKLPDYVKSAIVREVPEAPWQIILYRPGFSPADDKRTLWFTMWESSKLPSQAVEQLNRAECVAVPCQWNRECFAASGVKVPIEHIPLGINTAIFKYSPMDMEGPCIFGTGGRTFANVARKGLDLVTKAFVRAFPHEQDVRLRIKSFPDCPVPRSSDPRITVTKRYLTEKEMATWFSTLTCYVSGSRGEGWGLFQHQALASGRPLISARFGGIAEFFTDDVGYAIDFKIAPAGGRFANCHEWAEPDLESMIDSMRQVYRNREKARQRGMQGASRVANLTWARSNQRLMELMAKLKMI